MLKSKLNGVRECMHSTVVLNAGTPQQYVTKDWLLVQQLKNVTFWDLKSTNNTLQTCAQATTSLSELSLDMNWCKHGAMIGPSKGLSE